MTPKLLKRVSNFLNKNKKESQTRIFPFPKLFKGWFRSVPPIDPTNTICFTPAVFAVNMDNMIQAIQYQSEHIENKYIT